MSLSDDIPVDAIGRLALQPGDVVVVKTHGRVTLTSEQFAQFEDFVKKQFGDIPVIVIGDDVDLAVLTKAEIDARTEPVRLPPQRVMDLPVA